MIRANQEGRILIADDDDGFRYALLDVLRHDGYECMGVSDATATLAELRRGNYDLLVADIQMPGNRRLELIRELSVAAPGLPVILLTGDPSMETAAISVRLSVSAYLVKPPDLGELRALVKESIANHRVYQAVQREWKLIEALSHDAARQLEEGLLGTGDLAEGVTHQHLLKALAGLLHAGLRVDTAALHQLSLQAEVVQALQETIELLERTKRAFKSKQLGKLRERLEVILRRLEPAPSFPPPPQSTP